MTDRPDPVPHSPAALRSRLNSPGDYGAVGSVHHPNRHAQLLPAKLRNRRRCDCGCGGKQSHVGMANGVALSSGCEWSMRRWVRDPIKRSGVSVPPAEEKQP